MTRSWAEISPLKTPSTAVTDTDAVMSHHMQEIHFTKAAYK